MKRHKESSSGKIRIGVTGFSSVIGKKVSTYAGERGFSVSFLGRSSSQPDFRFFDLGSDIDDEIFRDLTAVIHLAWDWADRGRKRTGCNIKAGSQLANLSLKHGVRPVLLSTMSTLHRDVSMYGEDKFILEERFIEANGIVIRAGLVWGGEQCAGIVRRLHRMANLPIFAPYLRSTTQLHCSHIDELAQWLLEACSATWSRSSRVNGASVTTYELNEILGAMRRKSLGIPILVPSGLITKIVKRVEQSRIPLPISSDSLALLRSHKLSMFDDGSEWLPGFGAEGFLEWARSIDTTAQS